MSYLIIPDVLPYHTLPYLMSFLTLHPTLPYLTLGLTLPYKPPYLLPFLVLPYKLSLCVNFLTSLAVSQGYRVNGYVGV